MGCVYLCEDDCYSKYRKANDSPRSRAIRPRKMDQSYEHKCGLCSKHVDMKLEKTLTWETMDFCDAECLGTIIQYFHLYHLINLHLVF